MAEKNTQSPTPLAEITHAPSGFEQFLDKNQKCLIVGAILVVLGVLGFIVFRGIKDSNRLSASYALFSAEDETALKAVINEHDGSPSAATAQLLLSQKQNDNNEKGSAITTLEGFIASPQGHPATPAAIASLAAMRMNQGDSGKASDLFSQLLDDPAATYLAPYALLCLGDMAAAGDDPDKAEQYYQQAKTEYPSSSFLGRINLRIASLEAALPEEVEPPAKPADTGTELELPDQPSPLLPVQPDPPSGGSLPSPAIDSVAPPENPLLEELGKPESKTPENSSQESKTPE